MESLEKVTVVLHEDASEGGACVRTEAVVRCALRETDVLKVGVGLRQGSALSFFLFAVVLDRLTGGAGGGML